MQALHPLTFPRRQEDNWDTGSTDAVSPGGSDSDNEDADWIFLRDAAEADFGLWANSC